MATFPKDFDVKTTQTTSVIGVSTGGTLKDITTGVNKGINAPCRISAAWPTPDSKLYIEANEVEMGDLTGLSTPPISSQILSVVASTLDLQTGASTGATFVGFTLPSTTVGYCRRMGLTLLGDGTVQVLFTDEAATIGACANPGTIFASKGIPLGWVDLEATAATAFKTVGSATSIIENKVGANNRIHRFGSGGGGGGTGNADSVWEDMKDALNTLPYEFLDGTVISIDSNTKVDGSSTATFNRPSDAYQFSIGSTFITTNLFSAEFLAELTDCTEAFVRVSYDNSYVDTNPAVYLSRNGGNEYQAVTVSRIGTTSTWYGKLQFAGEASNLTLDTYAVANADSQQALTNTGSNQRLSQEFTTTQYEQVNVVNTYVNLQGAPSGCLYVSLYSDNSGSPGTLLLSTLPVLVSTLSSGNNTITLNTSGVLASSTKYHIVFETCDSYKSTYVASTHELRVRVDSSSPTIAAMKQYNGSTWAAISGNAAVYLLQGRAMDLRLKVVGATSGALLKGAGIYYGVEPQGSANYKLIQKYTIDSSANTYAFLVDKFYPDADLCKVYCVETGQVFRFGAFTLQGTTGGVNVIFPSGTFYSLPATTYTIVIDQTDGTTFDNSDSNAALILDNHLGSSNTNLDRSVAGRGILLRRNDGTLRELTIDNSDNIVIKSVP